MSRYKPDTERRARFHWTLAADRELRQLYADGYIVSMIARNMDLTSSAIKNRIHVLRLKRNIYRRPFTTRDLRLVRRKYANTPTRILARAIGRLVCSVHRAAWKLGIHKSAEFMEKGETGRILPGSGLGTTFRFKAGHVPANKGLHRPGYSLLHGRMAETTFKKGQRPHTWLPVGTVKFNPDGYLVRKIDDKPDNGRGASNKNWEFVHRRVWEDAHGLVPKGHRIWWKDGNHENCALENLELLTDKEHMARTTIHNLPAELKSTILWAGALKRRIRRMEREKQAERSAEPSVRNDRKVKGRRKADGSRTSARRV